MYTQRLWLNCVILPMNCIASVWIYGWGATLIVGACFLDTSVLLTSSFKSWHLCSVCGAVIQWTHLRALGVHVTFRNSSTSHRSPALHMRAHSTALLNWIVSHYNNFDGMSFLFQLGSYQQLISLCCMAPESLNHKLGARFRHNSCWAAAEASPSSLAGLYLLLASLARSLARSLFSAERFLEMMASWFFFFRGQRHPLFLERKQCHLNTR